jgi:hypothetical protein
VKNPRLPLAVSGRPWKDRMAHNAPESKRLREEARTQMQDLHGFDCTAAAELFMIDPKKLKGRVTCKRFDTAADALRFAIEEIPSLAGAYLEVDDRASDLKKSNTCMQTPAIHCVPLRQVHSEFRCRRADPARC